MLTALYIIEMRGGSIGPISHGDSVPFYRFMGPEFREKVLTCFDQITLNITSIQYITVNIKNCLYMDSQSNKNQFESYL